MKTEILDIVPGKCLIKSDAVSSAALSLKREEGIHSKFMKNTKFVKDILKCLKKLDTFDSMSVIMQMI